VNSPVSGATRVAAVIGDPVRHSLSPVLHNAAYRALGLDWVYVAFDVPDGAARHALDGARAFGLVGLSVTMPHKAAVAELCDECAPDAAKLHSVNTVTLRPDGSLYGESTDGEGFLLALRDAGHDVAGHDVLLLGAGGAARAVAVALAGTGARITITARRTGAAEHAAALVDAATVAWDQRADAARAATFVVNATPLGMGDGSLPVALEALGTGQVYVDLVYHPLETPMLQAAQARGAAVVDGLGMLVRQAGLQVERWTGMPAPLPEMRAAVRAYLSEIQSRRQP
jgi:shikimate dehydrogenase